MLLVMYGFCSNTALYVAIISFAIFIFPLTPFDIGDRYYLNQISPSVACKSVPYKNDATLF